jgi:hypothetical protein
MNTSCYVQMDACLEAGARVVGFYSVGLEDLSARVANASLPADVDTVACLTIASGANRYEVFAEPRLAFHLCCEAAFMKPFGLCWRQCGVPCGDSGGDWRR